jgi:hypothetical protein
LAWNAGSGKCSSGMLSAWIRELSARTDTAFKIGLQFIFVKWLPFVNFYPKEAVKEVILRV